ncbi:MAG: DUF349 domain-containing protein [Bacteroidales bacterium]|nr:DUF349 domain-containing protein [Bacteroidales bacterium]
MANSGLEDKTLEGIVLELRQLGASEDRMQRAKEVESIKSGFYKLLGTLKAEAEAAGENVQEKFADIENSFKEVYADFKREKAEFNKQQDEIRNANLHAKQAVIEELKSLVDSLDNVGEAFPKFREIQARWREIGPVPASDFRFISDSYQYLVERFYDMVQIDHDLRDLDFKRNLEAKENFCLQAEKLAESDDVVGSFQALQKLHEEWKEYGPVAKEMRDAIWDRFKAATALINKKYLEHFETLKASFAANLQAKEALCVEVENIAGKEDIRDGAQWNALSKEIEAIQEKWRTIGFASKKDNQKIYDRFRAACDKFYARKRDFFLAVKSDMDANVARKEAIIAKAEALKDSKEWKATSEALIALQKEWKEIGTVSFKKSEQLWKRFRAACDAFFEERDKNFKPENDFRGNLKAKKALIAEVNAYEGSDPAKAAEFNERWKAIGFVPFKEKEAVTREFKDAMSAKFQGKSSLVRKYNELQQEIATYENNIGFFSAGKNSQSLVADMQKRIESAKEELKALEKKIRNFEEGE